MVILLSREYGSGGRVIGEEVAKRLGYSFYDKEMIVKVAEETGLAQSYVKEHSEHSKGSSIFAYAFSPRDEAGVSLEDTLMNAQTKVIKKIAEEENAVIVGRCADYVLRDKKDKLTVFIYGNEPEKIERISKLRNISKEETLKFIKEMDKRRSIDYKYYTDQKWGDRKNYDIMLNSSVLGYEKTIDIICDLAKMKAGV